MIHGVKTVSALGRAVAIARERMAQFSGAGVRYARAADAVSAIGPALVGHYVETVMVGGWVGGTCVVTELGGDPAAPEIVMQVRRVSDGAVVGVFEWEPIEVLPAVTS